MVVLSNFIANGLLFYVLQSFLVEDRCNTKLNSIALFCFFLLINFFAFVEPRNILVYFLLPWSAELKEGLLSMMSRHCMISVSLNWSSIESSLVTSSFRLVNMMSQCYLLWKSTGLFCFLEPVLLLKCCFAYQKLHNAS